MAAQSNGDYESRSGSTVRMIDPRGIDVDWSKNISRGGVRPKVDESLKSLARSMIPRNGAGDTEEGTSGQLSPVIVRKVGNSMELVVGYRRLAAALWLIESGECPDFQIAYTTLKFNDRESAIANAEENLHRQDVQPVQLAQAVRFLSETCGMSMSSISKRLKKSKNWLTQIVGITELDSDIQQEVEEGETSASAAVALTKVAPKDRREVHKEAKARSKTGRVKASAVKAAAAERGSGGPTPRTTKQLRQWLELRTAPGEAKPSKAFARAFLAYLDGKPRAEDKLAETWDRLFAEVAVEA